MGYFKEIYFNNFRNFINSPYSFSKGCNIIVGKNGSGKTNILEGISLFEKGKGFRKEKIVNLINFQNQKNGFNIRSIFENREINYNAKILITDTKLKKISINNSFDTDSVKHFESLFSIIYFLPEMERLFVGPPSFRRNFLDRLIFTSNKNYNSIINNYKKAVSERQLLLKSNNYDESWIKEIEFNIAKYGINIYEKRLENIKIINDSLKKINIVDNFSNNFFLRIKDEFLEKNLKNFGDDNVYLNALSSNRKIDFYSGRCSIGPQLSDIEGFNFKNNFNLNQLSTGQQKTIVLLIIIAQSEYLIKNLNLKTIILLDEICSHLDDVNRELLLYLVNKLKVQSFMTGTEENYFSFLSTNTKYCNIIKL